MPTQSVRTFLLHLPVSVDRLLRSAHAGATSDGSDATDRTHSLTWLAGCILASELYYGAIMGTFGGVWGDRWLQVIYSALKLPLMLGVSFLVAVPSFFVIHSLLGLRQDFIRAIRALFEAQAVMALVLASLSPLTAFWYVSNRDYSLALEFNGLMMAIACLSAQGTLRHRYRILVARNPRHRWMLVIWLALYVFVAIEMAWVMRPFIGQSDLPVTFIRDDAWGNAYEVVFKLIWKSMRNGL